MIPVSEIIENWDKMKEPNQNMRVEELAFGLVTDMIPLNGAPATIRDPKGWRPARNFTGDITAAWELYNHLSGNERFEGWLNLLAKRITGLTPAIIAMAAYVALREQEELAWSRKKA